MMGFGSTYEGLKQYQARDSPVKRIRRYLSAVEDSHHVLDIPHTKQIGMGLSGRLSIWELSYSVPEHDSARKRELSLSVFEKRIRPRERPAVDRPGSRTAGIGDRELREHRWHSHPPLARDVVGGRETGPGRHQALRHLMAVNEIVHHARANEAARDAVGAPLGRPLVCR